MSSGSDPRLEDLLRSLAPQVLGALVRRYGHFDHAEDAVQEALIAAASQWRGAIPDSPRAWLITVASRRLTDLLRSESARLRREAEWVPPPPSTGHHDDSLVLLAMCCHPSLSAPDQIALTLRAVGGLSTAEVARAFLVPEATMARRISRAKQRIKTSGVPFALPAAFSAAVLHVLYLMFNEGYAATAGPDLHRPDLAVEAIRLTRLVHRLLPGDSEVTGLLALMLLTDARRPARTAPDGTPVPMDAQDRTLWNADLIAEGVALVTAALPRGPVGPYQVQAAIAALHDEAPSAGATDWPQIVALYELLMTLTDNPMVALNHAVAVTMAAGPAAGLALLPSLSSLAGDHRFHAVRGHLLEMSGDATAAGEAYTTAAGLTGSVPLQRYLHGRAARLRTGLPGT
ncbi:sigma-70 family RNA polymerase sigma factor [Dactylosporangium sp. NBC_01737]|uniref:RNA polymerase sigma factor n=1 Tax=Dactylosporangium sp. NBC_01737 TaxID=2975959 RepID=UPI002E161D36|nr:sigma-70 family RNA polymerase sigma factor [Dactylosporangium sp. NBC_01737]